VSWAIQTLALTKRFPPQSGLRRVLARPEPVPPAVNSVTLNVRSGELFGLLGLNGAGKTTLIKILCTLVLPTSGSAQINGFDLTQESAIKASIGLVTSDERSFYWRLSGRQNLEFFARLHNIPDEDIKGRVQGVLDTVGLGSIADDRFLTYATGMRQRLSIARALLNRPRLLFLDEPTKGLDPLATQRLHSLIREQLVDDQGITVFLTTHDLTEAANLCDRLAIMNRGCIIACGTLDELVGKIGSDQHESLQTLFINLLDSSRTPEIPVDVVHLEDQPDLPARLSQARLGLSLRVALAFLKKDLVNELSYPVSFLLQMLSIFFAVGVFYFISQLLGNSVSNLLAPYGGTYFPFVLIGIAFSSYFGVGLSSFANNLRLAQTTGTLEAMLTTPTSISAIIWASALWDYLLTTLKVFVYLAIGGLWLGVNFNHGNVVAALAILILTLLSFSSIGIIAASFVMVLKRGDPIAWFFNTLSGLLGGVYYPLDVMPGWMRWLAGWLPITYALQAMRLALLQGASTTSLLPQMLTLAAFGLVLFPLSLVAFRVAVRRAKLEGSLSHY
jgi:ABC-type multidrug transport system ATPase subunit/ABC-type multidrug transport system permease subunit